LLGVERGSSGPKGPVPKGICPQSRRDGPIVAWHEVPGTARSQKSRPVGYGLIRSGMRTDSRIGVITFLKKHGAPFDENPLGLGLRPIIPCPTGRFFWGGAVPGTSCQATIGPSLRD
jgi:hypothetical protein